MGIVGDVRAHLLERPRQIPLPTAVAARQHDVRPEDLVGSARSIRQLVLGSRGYAGTNLADPGAGEMSVSAPSAHLTR